MSKVYIVGGDELIARMFKRNDVEVSEFYTDDIDFLCFTGGHDVSPELYGEQMHPTTHRSKLRDDIEQQVYQRAISNMKPMVGICRGGQFLNVMNGGKMYQNVDRHTCSHYLHDTSDDRKHFVTSTHHQMMIPCDKTPGCNSVPIIVAVAYESTFKETYSKRFLMNIPEDYSADTEVLFYPDTDCLCFQPHPEYESPTTRAYFFELLQRFEII